MAGINMHNDDLYFMRVLFLHTCFSLQFIKKPSWYQRKCPVTEFTVLTERFTSMPSNLLIFCDVKINYKGEGNIKIKVLCWDSSRLANLNNRQKMAVLGVFLALVLCLCCLRFEKELSIRWTSVSPRVLAGGWFFLWYLSLWACLIFLWCNTPCNLEVPFWGSPLQLPSQPWRQSMVHAKGMEGDGNQESAGQSLACFISVRQQSLLPVYTEGLHSAWALVSCTLWPTLRCLPYWGLYCRTGLGTQVHSQPLLQGFPAGQVPADVNFQMPWHSCVTSEAPLPKTAALCFQFPHVWPSSLYHLTGSE